MTYHQANLAYWERGYNAPNVDGCIFRFYGRILRHDFGLTGNGEKLLDFGCGQGAAVQFFNSCGFNAYGCDISKKDISIAQARFPNIGGKFSVCDPNPFADGVYCGQDKLRVAISIQTLYYLSDTDFAKCMEKLYAAMLPGAVFYATMMGEQCEEFFKNSVPAEDGLRAVSFNSGRLQVDKHYMSFIKDADHMKRKFSMFKPKHIGHYSQQYREDEGDGFHWTFCGVKD